MNFSSINWLAVIVCVLASMVIGSLWYNPKTFFPIWWKAIGKSDSSDPGTGGMSMGLTWGLVIFAAFVQAVFMALLVNALGDLMGGISLVSGATIGFLLWLGFVAPSSLTNKLFAGQLKAWAIEASNHLLNYIVIGAILGAWR